MLMNYEITKTFLSGIAVGLTVKDTLVRHDTRLGAPFHIGQVVKGFGSTTYRVTNILPIGPYVPRNG